MAPVWFLPGTPPETSRTPMTRRPPASCTTDETSTPGRLSAVPVAVKVEPPLSDFQRYAAPALSWMPAHSVPALVPSAMAVQPAPDKMTPAKLPPPSPERQIAVDGPLSHTSTTLAPAFDDSTPLTTCAAM